MRGGVISHFLYQSGVVTSLTTRYGRADTMWLLRLGHQIHAASFHLVLWEHPEPCHEAGRSLSHIKRPRVSVLMTGSSWGSFKSSHLWFKTCEWRHHIGNRSSSPRCLCLQPFESTKLNPQAQGSPSEFLSVSIINVVLSLNVGKICYIAIIATTNTHFLFISLFIFFLFGP